MRRFKQEACAASALNHPNILTIHEIGQVDGCHFMISEYVEGETLRQRLSRSHMILNEVIDVATRIAEGLAAAHTVGIVHRDIKPENIMLRPDGYVKILDFALAKLGEPSGSDLSINARLQTATGVVMGTTRYMSPEQARGLAVDARTDVWSLGVVIYEMLSGRAPFDGPTNSDVLASILEREPASLASAAPEVPAKLRRVVEKALRKDREQRFRSGRLMALPCVGEFGSLGRGAIRAPYIKNIDLSVAKNWQLSDRYSLQFRAEMFNALNRVNVSDADINTFLFLDGTEKFPDGTINPNFGKPLNSNFGRITTTRSPREIQFGLKFTF